MLRRHGLVGRIVGLNYASKTGEEVALKKTEAEPNGQKRKGCVLLKDRNYTPLEGGL